jgi:hypothetical protein
MPVMFKPKFFYSLLLFVSSSLLGATPPQNVVTRDIQVFVLKEHRVRNRSGSQCVWCSLECLARLHGIEKASHLTDRYKGTAGPGDVRFVLGSYGVAYQMRVGEQGKDKKFLKVCCENGWGACVGVHGSHMINVVHYRDGIVKVIDNSDPELRVQEWTEQRFLNAWDGWAVTLVPPIRWI